MGKFSFQKHSIFYLKMKKIGMEKNISQREGSSETVKPLHVCIAQPQRKSQVNKKDF
jgi:hypothetical protein